MRVIVKARHMSLTPALKAHAEEKLGRSMMRVFDQPAAKIEIELSELGDMRDQASKECRVAVFVPHGRAINITEVSDDMYKAIDVARDRLITQVKRERDRRRSIGQNRKTAEKERHDTAQRNLTAPQETWEKEVQEYELSLKAV